MNITLEGRFGCLLCGYQHKVWSFPSARVNKRSVRITGPSIIAGPFWQCPECGTPALEPLKVKYRLLPASEAEVRAYREKRWPELAGDR